MNIGGYNLESIFLLQKYSDSRFSFIQFHIRSKKVGEIHRDGISRPEMYFLFPFDNSDEKFVFQDNYF